MAGGLLKWLLAFLTAVTFYSAVDARISTSVAGGAVLEPRGKAPGYETDLGIELIPLEDSEGDLNYAARTNFLAFGSTVLYPGFRTDDFSNAQLAGLAEQGKLALSNPVILRPGLTRVNSLVRDARSIY